MIVDFRVLASFTVELSKREEGLARSLRSLKRRYFIPPQRWRRLQSQPRLIRWIREPSASFMAALHFRSFPDCRTISRRFTNAPR